MKKIHKHINSKNRKNNLLKLSVLILVIVIAVAIKIYKDKPIKYTKEISYDCMIDDLDVLYDQIQENYMNIAQTKKYNDVDFLNIKPNFKSEIKADFKEKNRDLTSQEAYEWFNKILSKLYDHNTSISDKYTYNKISSHKELSYLFTDISKNRYADLEYINPSYDFKAYDIRKYDDSLYIKVSDFDSVNIKKDSEIFSKIIKENKDKKQLIIDLRDNQSDNLDYAVNVIIKPLLKSDINVDFKSVHKSSPVIVKNILDKNNITFKTSEINGKANIKGSSTDAKYITNFNLNLKKSDNFNGNIYILQNKNTKNSADFVCQIANRSKFATTVGETTSGNGLNIIHTYKLLPNTGFVVEYPLGSVLNEDGSINEEEGTKAVINLDDNTKMVQSLLDRIN